MKMLRVGTCLVFGVLVLGTIFPKAVFAADAFNVTTSPLPIVLTTKPGSTTSTDLRIKNTGAEAIKIKVGLLKFTAAGERGQPNLQERRPGDDYFDWVKFSPAVFDAEPDVWKTIKMTISVPPTAALGYYYAATFSPASTPASKAGQPHTSVTGSSASLILLNVDSGLVKRSLKVTEFSSEHKLYQFLPAKFTVRVHNDGNIFAAPGGNIFIKQGSKTVATLDFNSAGGNILPNTDRVFNLSWKNGFPVYTDKLVDGKPIVTAHGNKQKLTWDFSHISKLRFGKYKAVMFLVYSDGSRDIPVQATLSFWVIPWVPLLVILLVVLVILIGFWSASRNALKKVFKKEPKRKK